MDNQTGVLIIFCTMVTIVYIVFHYYYYYKNKVTIDKFSNNIEDATTQIVTNEEGSCLANHKYTDYDFATLQNGTLQKIKEILQNVIDQNNCDTRMIDFNPTYSPVTKCELEQNEFDDYGKYLVHMMNTQISYTCFKFISAEPEFKIKTDRQTKIQFYINVDHKHPGSKEKIHFRFLVVLLNEKLYSEFNGFNEEPTAEQLPFDIVPDEGKTYIEVFTISNVK